MHHYFLPKYRTPEEINALRKSRIEHSMAYNTEWALNEFNKNPDVEFDFWTPGDVYELLGMHVADIMENAPNGWFVIHGKKPEVHINGMTLEAFKEQQRKLLDRLVVEGKVEIIK